MSEVEVEGGCFCSVFLRYFPAQFGAEADFTPFRSIHQVPQHPERAHRHRERHGEACGLERPEADVPQQERGASEGPRYDTVADHRSDFFRGFMRLARRGVLGVSQVTFF